MKFLTFLTAAAIVPNAFADPAEDFAAESAKIGQKARSANQFSTRGEDENWFFNVSELLHTGTGEFWTKDWKSVATNGQNPVPFLVHFQQLLEAKGIELLLVPVPAKTTIYPDKLASQFKPGDPVATKPFFDQLEEAGLTVLDLEPVFAEERAEGREVHCAQDSHFTPHACSVIAKLVVDQVRDEDWFKNQARPVRIQRSAAMELGIVGDLVPDELKSKVAETLTIQYCGVLNAEAKLEVVKPDPASPILLLGDSHTLVFNEGATGGMHSIGAGLLDQLQAEAGFALDLVGSRGSGSKTARMQLYRHAAASPGYWDSKKLVIWCFSVREFTQSMDTLQEIPIERK